MWSRKGGPSKRVSPSSLDDIVHPAVNTSWFRERERKTKSLQGNLILITIVFRMKGRERKKSKVKFISFGINDFQLGTFSRNRILEQLRAHVTYVARSWVIDVHKFNFTRFLHASLFLSKPFLAWLQEGFRLRAQSRVTPIPKYR